MTTEPRVIWQPNTGAQSLFLACPVREVLLEGGRGGGKTDVLLMDFAQHVGQGFENYWRGILFRQTYKQLDDVISKSKRWFPRIFGDTVAFNQQKTTWTWKSGEELLLRHLKDKSDYEGYHGHELPWIAFEELTTWASGDLFRAMMSTNRTSKAGVPLKIRATTNPYGAGHSWVKQRYMLPQMRNTVMRNCTDENGNPVHDRVAIFTPLEQNRILLDADPTYRQTIAAAARNASERAAWLDADWNIVAGGMFDDIWHTHSKYFILPPFFMPDNWKMYRSFDWGSSKPFSVGWWAISNGEDLKMRDGTTRSTVPGDLFRVAEWYGCRKGYENEGLRISASAIAQGIKEREQEWGIHARVKPGPADTSIWDNQNDVCIANDMAREGVRFVKANKSRGTRVQRWEKIRSMMKNTAYPREKPGIFVSVFCTDSIRVMPTLPRDDNNLDDIDTDAEDHIADEWGYTVLFKPTTSSVESF